jgi:hypothetical protein
MASTKRVSVHIKLPSEFLEVLRAEKERAEDNREHLPVGLQIERALYAYLVGKKLIKRAGRKGRNVRAKADAADSAP